jgi:hypothetical protein
MLELPAGPLGLHLLGILCAHEGRYEEAEAAFLRAVEADAELAGSYVELGFVYACRSKYVRMVEALRRAVGVGAGGVRAYLGGHPLGEITTGPAAEVVEVISQPGGEGWRRQMRRTYGREER